METAIAAPALPRRFPVLRLAVPDEQARFAVEHPIHGLESLPVTW